MIGLFSRSLRENSFGISEIQHRPPAQNPKISDFQKQFPMTEPHQERPLIIDRIDRVKLLGPYLKKVRKDQGLRIDDAASLLGVAVDTLSRLENSVGAVRLDKLLAILEGLGLAMLIGAKDDLARIIRDQDEALRDERDGRDERHG
jgi:DNA-binding XRE family transcriptional regulator